MNFTGLEIETATGRHKVVAHDEPRYDWLGDERKRVRFNALLDDGSKCEIETTSSSWVLRGVAP